MLAEFGQTVFWMAIWFGIVLVGLMAWSYVDARLDDFGLSKKVRGALGAIVGVTLMLNPVVLRYPGDLVQVYGDGTYESLPFGALGFGWDNSYARLDPGRSCMSRQRSVVRDDGFRAEVPTVYADFVVTDWQAFFREYGTRYPEFCTRVEKLLEALTMRNLNKGGEFVWYYSMDSGERAEAVAPYHEAMTRDLSDVFPYVRPEEVRVASF